MEGDNNLLTDELLKHDELETAHHEEEVVNVPHMDVDELAEQAMMELGLQQSQVLDVVTEGLFPLQKEPSLVFASAADLVGDVQEDTLKAAVADVHEFEELLPSKPVHTINPGEDAVCMVAKTILLIPFAFWPTEDKDPPSYLANQLLRRKINADGSRFDLWERTGLPKEVSELSLHFRQLLGQDASPLAPVQRLRVTESARTFLFSGARLWGDLKTGDSVGKSCEWTGIHLLIFPHGAILSISVDWLPSSTEQFLLSQLRMWVYLSKFRTVKVGVTKGWSFTKRASPPMEEIEMETESLGLKLYAAVYGGSCISLGSIANWLVKMPSESSSSIPRRIARFDYCLHHTCIVVEKAPLREKLEEYLFHIRRAHGAKHGAYNKNDTSGRAADQVVQVRSNALIGIAREGVVGIEWESTGKKTFVKQFMGIFGVLTLHCLSERATLEKLSYLAALQTQNLPTPGVRGTKSLAEKEGIRRELMALATMLVRYRSSMASDDCGGRSEFREYFQELRQVYSVAALKNELREELQDTLAIVESDWMEEKREAKNRELVWKLKKDEISKRRDEIRERRKRVFDVLYSAFSALGLPFLLIANVWSMNNYDLPRSVSWAYLMIGCGLCSVVLFFIIYFNFNVGRPQMHALAKEEKMLNEVRLEQFDGAKVMDEQLSKLAEKTLGPAEEERPRFRLFHKRPAKKLLISRERSEGEVDKFMEAMEATSVPLDNMDSATNYMERPKERFSMDDLRNTSGFMKPQPARKSFLSWFSLPTKTSSMPPAAAVPEPSRRLDDWHDMDENFKDEERSPADPEYLSPPRGFSIDLVRPVTPVAPAKSVSGSSIFGRRIKAQKKPSSSAPAESAAVTPKTVSIEVSDEFPKEKEEENASGSMEYLPPARRDFSFDIPRPNVPLKKGKK